MGFFKDLDTAAQIDIIVSSSMVIEDPISGDPLLLEYPTLKHRRIADFIYNKAIKKADSNGIYTKEKMLSVLEDRGVITKEMYEKEEFYKKQIDANKVLLSKMKFSEKKIAILKTKIARMEADLAELVGKRELLLSTTSDSLAMSEKLNYLVWSSVFSIDGTPVWDTFDAFMDETNMDYKNKIHNEVVPFLLGFDMSELRYIARSMEWRVRYTAYIKGNFPLFSTSPENYTKDQLGLVHWSNYYQSIYDMLPEDRPDDTIINNDYELDKYMEEYFKNIEQETRINKAKNKGSDAFDREEVIVTRFNDNYQELEYDKVKPKGEGTVVHEGRRRK